MKVNKKELKYLPNMVIVNSSSLYRMKLTIDCCHFMKNSLTED